MKTQDLYLEYARVIKMCEGTVIKPWECVRFSEFETFNNHPKFDCYPPSDYKFAITILEDKPVFVWDEIFIKDNKYPAVNWSLFDYWKDKISELSKDWTWEKPQPKRRSINDPMRWAEGLIEQLPDSHEGAISWLMHHGDGDKADAMRNKFNFKKMTAIKEQINTAIHWADRCKEILGKDVITQEERIELETLCAIAIELIKSASPSKLREAGRIVEIRYRIKNE